MSIARKAVKGTVWVTGASYSAFIVGFATQLILVRLLFPEDFGLYALAVSILELITVFFSWSFPLGLIQIDEGEHLTDTAFILSLVQGLAFLVVASVGSLVVGRLYSFKLAKVIFVIGLGRSLTFVAYIYSAVLEKELEYMWLSIARLAVTVTSVLGALGLAFAGFGVWSLAGRELLMAGGSLAAFRFIAPWRFRWRFDGDSARKLLQFGWGMLFARGFESAYHRLDNLMVGVLLGMTTLGFYSQARYLVDLGNTAVQPATAKVAFPTFSRLKSDKARLARAYQTTNYFLVRLMLPAALILCLFPEPIIALLYGAKWKPAAPILRVLGLYILLTPVFANIKSLLFALGRPAQVAKLRLIQVLILVPSLLAGVALWGAEGAAGAFILAQAAGVILAFIYTKEYTLSSLAKNYRAPLLSGAISLIVWGFFVGFSSPFTSSMALILSSYLLSLMVIDGKELFAEVSYIFGRVVGFKAR